MKNRIKVAKFMFSLGALLGILSAGGAGLYAVAYTPGSGTPPIKEALTTFLIIFVPVSVLWSSFCYLGHKGLTSNKTILKFKFWFYVVWNVFVFPIGTVIAGVSVWLWRDLRRQNIDRGFIPTSKQ